VDWRAEAVKKGFRGTPNESNPCSLGWEETAQRGGDVPTSAPRAHAPNGHDTPRPNGKRPGNPLSGESP
jgi:hypothetical protein